MELKQDELRYFFEDDGELIGEIDFTYVNDHTISINHTVVDPAYRGQGLAMQLLDKVIQFSRENDLKIIPICPFAKRKIKEDPELHDVLTPEYLENLEKEN
ncbi:MULTISPECIES: GNAT family N-acetyltransferase [Lactobacillaceae]|uniref:GNAT family N-acetyltransferase n=1 Tax=Lactobacillaceae TaxID=33958 RepID=UPI000C1B65F2|nr:MULTISPECIES: GNAT family N-acetyltransferase [Lactobacillaceae]